MVTYDDLLNELVFQGVLEEETPLYRSFAMVDRMNFVRKEDKSVAYMNSPLYIGHGQTVPQPYVVAFMLNLLNIDEGNKVLEIGYGSGWQTVILSEMAGNIGEIHATEIVPEIKKFGEKNINKYSNRNISLYEAVPGKLGVDKELPFDKIISGASADELPQSLIDQLGIGGTLVLPVKDNIVKIDKDSKGEVSTLEFPGFVFVPLVT